MGLEHLRNLALIQGAEVVAIADPVERSRGWARKTVGAELPAFEDHRQLIAEIEVDALVIASPNHTHASVLDDLWGTGKHLLVEKPLCTTLEDCRRVRQEAERHDGIVWVGMEYRYMPPVARLIEEVHTGATGRLRMVSIREHRQPFLEKVGDWNRFNRNTGGTLVEKCCHFFDLMVQITGQSPVRVFASGAQDNNHLEERYEGQTPDILDNAFVMVDFDDGARGLLDLCMFAEGSRNEQEICATGDRGKVECFVPESKVVIGRRADRTVEVASIPVDEAILAAGHHHGATYFEHLRFQAAIRGEGRVEVSVDDGALAVAMGVAAHRSIELGEPVEVEL